MDKGEYTFGDFDCVPTARGSLEERERASDANFDQLERQHPGLIRLMAPRLFSTSPRCGNFFPAKTPARVFAMKSLLFLRTIEAKGEPDPGEQTDFAAVAQWLSYKAPQLWISEEIAAAILNTTPPISIEWSKMPLPFPSMVFMVPRGAIHDEIHGDVRFIMYCRVPPNAKFHHPLMPWLELGTPGRSSFVIFYIMQSGHMNAFNFNETDLPYIELEDLQSTLGKFIEAVIRENTIDSTDPQEDLQTMRSCLHLLFGALLLIEARPELLERGQLQNRVKAKKGISPKEFWTPHVLGAKYHVRREPGEAQGGTHASPRMHWVRGFFRDQPHGPGRSLRRIIWVEPFTRGAKSNEA